MIQRIQSIFLFLASGSLLSLFKIPFSNTNNAIGQLYADQQFNIMDNQALMLLTVIGGLLSLVSIFLFRNRKIQLNVNYLFALVCVGICGFSWWLYQSNLPNESETSVAMGIGLFMPIVSLILSLLASYFIKKDDKLVESMDRLR